MSIKLLSTCILVTCLATAAVKADDMKAALDQARQSLNNVHCAAKWIQLQKRAGHWRVVYASLGRFDRDFEWKQLEQLTSLESLRLSDELSQFAKNAGIPDLSALQNLRQLELLPWDLTEPMTRSLAKLPHFEQVEIHDFRSDGRGRESALIALKHLPRLRRLKLQGTRLTDRMLVHLQALPDLEELDLQGNDDLTNAGLAHLSSLRKLKVLNVSLGSKVTAASLESFQQFTELRDFQMAYTDFEPNDIAALQPLAQLEFLACGSKSSTADLTALAGLKTLQFWSRTTESVSFPAGLRHLLIPDSLVQRFDGTTLPQLEHVDVWCSIIKDAPFVSLADLSQLPNLRSLKIKNASDQRLKSIAHLINLEELELGRSGQCECWFGDDGILALRNLHQLQVLKTDALHLTPRVLTVLSNFPNLRHLDISVEIDPTDSHLEQIWALKKLRILDLNLRSPAGHIDELFDKLAELPELEDLRINGNTSDDALLKLSKLNRLKRLNLSYNHSFTYEGLTQLLQSTPSLEQITLHAESLN